MYNTTTYGDTADVNFREGVEFWRGVNPLEDQMKLDNYVMRAMQDVMKLIRVTSNCLLRNWDALTCANKFPRYECLSEVSDYACLAVSYSDYKTPV